MQDAFDLYHQVHEKDHPASTLPGPGLPALGHATAGATGAAISNLVTYPLALIVTRLQLQRSLRKGSVKPAQEEYTSLSDAAKKIYKQEHGLTGFYTGILSDTVKTVADSFLFFLAYNYLRQARLRSRGGSARYLPVVDELGVGFLAGAFSKFLTTPIANVVTRQQAASMISNGLSEGSRGSSMRATALQIQDEKGIRGFWSGYSASIVLTLNPSLTFFLFETLKRLLVPRRRRSNPPPQATFFIAAVSKAIASSITYPFSLAKSRLQASSKSLNEKHSTHEKVGQEQTGASKHDETATKKTGNVFDTILLIARTEGLGALYEGLSGEVLKGFLSHGLTMILKQAVHTVIIRLYYAILKLLKRFPEPDATIEKASMHTKRAVTGAHRNLQPLATSASKGFEDTATIIREQASSTVSDVREDAKSKVRTAKRGLAPAVEKTNALAKDELKGAKSRTNLKHEG